MGTEVANNKPINTYKDIKIELNSYKYYRIRINKLKSKIESLNSAITYPTSSIIVPPNNENTGTKENKFITLLDLKKEYENLVIVAEKVCLELDAKINKVKNHVSRCVLYLKYCELKSIEEISYMLHYSSRQIKRFLNKGLEEYLELYKKSQDDPKCPFLM